jgi:putative Ca2+/H+ antiporter (TMEM165/GDT1 family)
VHGVSVTIGHFLGLTLPERPIAFVAAVAFLGFAVWTWRGGGEDDGDVTTVAEPRFVIFAVISSFVLAELGDKTMLATVALASDHNWAGVWIGATVGMVLADGVAVAAGRLLHKRLPERFLHVMASLLFLLFGLWILFDGALRRPVVAIVVTATVGATAVFVGIVRWLMRRRTSTSGSPLPDAQPESAAGT